MIAIGTLLRRIVRFDYALVGQREEPRRRSPRQPEYPLRSHPTQGILSGSHLAHIPRIAVRYRRSGPSPRAAHDQEKEARVDDHDIRELIGEVKRGRLSRR